MVDKLPNTELLFDENLFIDQMSTNNGLRLLLKSQLQAVKSIEKSMLDIEIVIEEIFKKIKKHKTSRLIYVGAGTSGRIGVQDGVELYPTFGWPVEKVSFILAGGKESLVKSIENAEDDILSASKQVKQKKIVKEDIVIGIAASGNTSFTLQVIREARKRGALTIGISNNEKGNLILGSELAIILRSGKEVLAGSTRLAAGTTQKICLNFISTMVMAKLGRVKFGRMNFLVANNKKLRERKIGIEKIIKN